MLSELKEELVLLQLCIILQVSGKHLELLLETILVLLYPRLMFACWLNIWNEIVDLLLSTDKPM